MHGGAPAPLLDGLCSLLPCRRRRSKGPRIVVIRRSGSAADHGPTAPEQATTPAAAAAPVTIRLATFNAAMFCMAPAVPPVTNDSSNVDVDSRRGLAKTGSGRRRPKKGILKAQSRASSPSQQQHRRVSINLQDDEISTEAETSSRQHVNGGAGAWNKGKGKAVVVAEGGSRKEKSSSGRTQRSAAAEVLREVGADIVALQNVRAEQERGMRPLSELAEGLGMRYVFAESWAPEYGNAVLSRWPIKAWKAHRIADHSDLR
jgi:hypothetical protein